MASLVSLKSLIALTLLSLIGRVKMCCQGRSKREEPVAGRLLPVTSRLMTDN